MGEEVKTKKKPSSPIINNHDSNLKIRGGLLLKKTPLELNPLANVSFGGF